MAESLLELFRENARNRAERPAFVFLGDGESVRETVTFGALAQRAENTAQRLLAHAEPGDRALLLLEPGLDYVESFLGCLWAGIVAVPAYPARRNAKTERIDRIVENARPRLALTDDTATAARFESRLPVLLARGEGAGEAGGPASPALAPYLAEPGDVAFLQYTSGSTGSPRGVMVTHGNLVHNERTIRDAFRPDPDELSVTWLPPYHDMGLIGTMLQPLAVGMTTIVLTPATFLQRPLRWLAAISKYRATYSGGPDFAYALAARSAQSDAPVGLDLSSWEVAYQGAERVRPETLARFTEVFAPFGFRREAFAPCFGLAEATLMVTAVGRGERARELTFSAEKLEAGELVPAGVARLGRSFMACGPARGCEVRIVDPTALVPCAPGRIGEIWVSGPSVAPGYFPGDGEADAAFRAELPGSTARWLRTGDLGGLVDGELVVTGRLKDLIIIDGRNHAPEDLEATAVESDPAFVPHGAVAFSFEQEGRERVVIAVEIRRTAVRTFRADAPLFAVRQAVSEAHGIALWDVAFVRPNALPRTSSGKLRRRACADAYRRGQLARVEDRGEAGAAETDARSALMALIRRLVAEELNLSFDAVDPAAPLTALGLDSLSAEVLAGRLSRELGREIPPTIAYDHPTIERIAAHLSNPGATPDAAGRSGPDPLELGSLATVPAPSHWEAFTPSKSEALPPRWILFGGDLVFDAALESRLRAWGDRAKVLRLGSQDLDSAALRVGADDGAWEVLLREHLPPGKRFGVAYAGLDGQGMGGPALLELLRALIRVGRANDLVLRVVTRGMPPQVFTGTDPVPSGYATLRNVLGALAARHPGADVRLVGADRQSDPEVVITALLAGGDEIEVAVREALYFVPR